MTLRTDWVMVHWSLLGLLWLFVRFERESTGTVGIQIAAHQHRDMGLNLTFSLACLLVSLFL